jgi:molybdenum cofactor cytidylyltransferase
MSLPVILLAAGGSRRLGQPKQLVRVGAETLLARAIRVAQEAEADPVIVVLGAEFGILHELIRHSQVTIVENSRWQEGIASSIRIGLATLRRVVPKSDGALIMSCDQPRLTVEHLQALRQRFEQHDRNAIVASSYQGVMGVPAVFPSQVFAELEMVRGDEGARRIITRRPHEVISVPFAGGEFDIDSPEDLARLQSDS